MAGVWDRFQSLIFGAAIGRAGSEAITPVLEPVRQEAWSKNKLRVLDLGRLGELVARGFTTAAQVEDEAGRNGYDRARLEAAAALAQRYPGLGELDRLANRLLIDPAQLEKALSRHGYGKEWHKPLADLFADLLSPNEVANAVQQGHVPNEGILPEIDTRAYPPPGYVAPQAPDGHPPSEVPLTTIPIPPIKEAAGSGVDEDRLKVLANLSGLPPPQGELLQMLNRGLITDETFDAGVREGHTKTKWIGAVKRLRWAVLSGQEYAEAQLRDWITPEEMYAGGALTGHTKEQMDLFYKNRGRPATPRQTWLAWARKIPAPDYPGDPANGRLAGLKDHELAIRRSNIRPEYARMLWDVRFNYPPLFQLNRLVQSGAIDADTAALWAEYNLNAPEVVDALKRFWNKSSTGANREATGANLRAEYEGRHISRAELLARLEALGYSAAEAEDLADLGDFARIKKYRDAVMSAVYKAYLAHDLQAAEARAKLIADGIGPDAADELLRLWALELSVTRKGLTDAQVATAYRRATLTQADAIEELVSRGYSAEDAAAVLGLARPELTAAQIQKAYAEGIINRATAVTQLLGEGYTQAQADELVDTAVPPAAP